MLFPTLAAFAALVLQSPAAAPPASKPAAAATDVVRYKVVPDLATQKWTIDVSFRLADAKPFEFWLPRMTPGAYHTADYGELVEELTAKDATGNALKVVIAQDPVRWQIDPGKATDVQVRYVAPHATPQPIQFEPFFLDVEGNRIKDDYAYFNPASLLGFVPELRKTAVDVELAFPSDWKIATALVRDSEGHFDAPSYLRLEDSPVLAAATLEIFDFEVAGTPHVLATFGKTRKQAESIAEKCRKLAEGAKKLMGSLPYDRYVFLVGFPPEGGAAALEHSFSTLVLTPAQTPASELQHVLAHEYFHLWNAERIHVQAIEALDQTKPLVTGTIWMNEGGTEYFCEMVKVHGGLQTPETFFKRLAKKNRGVHDSKRAVTGASLPQYSRGWENPQGLIGGSGAIYERGAITQFGLDLAIRAATKGEKGLITVFRYLMDHYVAHGKGYGEDELQEIFQKSTGVDLADYFRRHVDGKELPDLGKLLAPLGLRVDATSWAFVDVDGVTPEQKALREAFFK